VQQVVLVDQAVVLLMLMADQALLAKVITVAVVARIQVAVVVVQVQWASGEIQEH
jgi:hypothetical protein